MAQLDPVRAAARTSSKAGPMVIPLGERPAALAGNGPSRRSCRFPEVPRPHRVIGTGTRLPERPVRRVGERYGFGTIGAVVVVGAAVVVVRGGAVVGVVVVVGLAVVVGAGSSVVAVPRRWVVGGDAVVVAVVAGCLRPLISS